MNTADPLFEPEKQQPDKHRIQFDLTLPIPIMLTIAMQTVIFAWIVSSWVTAMDTRMAIQEKGADFRQSEIDKTAASIATLSTNVAIIQDRQNTVIKLLDKMQERVDRNGDLLQEHTEPTRKTK